MVEDCKGVRIEGYRIKRYFMCVVYGIEIKEMWMDEYSYLFYMLGIVMLLYEELKDDMIFRLYVVVLEIIGKFVEILLLWWIGFLFWLLDVWFM